MTEPRQIVRGTTYHVTRRTLQQRFLLIPDRIIRNTFIFCLAYAASKFGILVHAFVSMSNHYHVVITDPEAKLPRFQQWMNQKLAGSVLEYREMPGPLWHPGSYDAVVVGDPDGLDQPITLEGGENFEGDLGEPGEDIERAMDYVFLNPVSAGLVDTRSEWEGCSSSYRDIAEGTVLRATRPEHGFSAEDLAGIPEEVELVLTPPPHWMNLAPADLEKLCAEADARLDSEERAIVGKREKATAARGPLPLASDPLHQPRSAMERPKPWTRIRPRFAGARLLRRKIRLARLRTFLETYRDCLNAIRRNPIARIVFPVGTYWQRSFFGRPVESPNLCTAPLTTPG
ncbi:MAG: hypothetical protein AAF517_05420 [Planctomycetota bacterium]